MVAPPAAVVVTPMPDDGVLAAVELGLSSEPQAASAAATITTANIDVRRRRTVEVHPFTSFMWRT